MLDSQIRNPPTFSGRFLWAHVAAFEEQASHYLQAGRDGFHLLIPRSSVLQVTDMDKDALSARIRAAFPDPGWPKEKEASDAGDGDLDREFIREHFEGSKWRDLTTHELGWMSQDGWAFTTEALVYFLPAWLLDDLENDGCHIERLASYYARQSDLLLRSLNHEQKRVLLEFLEATVGDGRFVPEEEPEVQLLTALRRDIGDQGV
jgi:hypothetical protein